VDRGRPCRTRSANDEKVAVGGDPTKELGLTEMKTFLTVVFTALPLIVLVIDFFRYPFLKMRMKLEKISVESLLTEPIIELGIYNANRIQIALDSVNSDKFLSYETEGPKGLVISHFVDEGERSISEGELGRAVRDKLNRFSPNDNQNLVDKLPDERAARAGEVFDFPLTIPKSNYQQFPIDRLFIVLLDFGPWASLVANSVSKVLDRAKKARISKIILPCLGYKWNDKNSSGFDDYFGEVFKSLAKKAAHANVCFSIYSEWPTFTLEEAVSSLNRVWGSGLAWEQKFEIYRSELRAVLLFTSICLLASSFYTPLTLKNFLIIAISYAGLATGSSKLVNFYTQGQGPRFRLFFQIAVWIILAVAFPFLAHWNPSHVFGAGGE
jgi:hypothetical protein